MADRGGFVNVPGIGRRFRTLEGEYRYGAPGDVTAGIIPRIEKFFGRLFAPNPLQGDPTGRYIPGNMQVPFTVPAAPVLPAAANSATGGGGGQPQFKAQPMTSQGQFDRYFGTSEMDPFFGSSSRGAGAPKTAEEMMALATQQKAPMETPLSTYYRSQSAAGRAEMPAITEGLGYAKGTPLAQWAEANPMLAKRLFEKTKAKKAAGTEEDAYAHPRDLGAGAQAEQGYTLAAYGLK